MVKLSEREARLAREARARDDYARAVRTAQVLGELRARLFDVGLYTDGPAVTSLSAPGSLRGERLEWAALSVATTFEGFSVRSHPLHLQLPLNWVGADVHANASAKAVARAVRTGLPEALAAVVREMDASVTSGHATSALARHVRALIGA